MGVCKGTDKEKESCKDKECPVDCTWAQWGDWSDCSKTCGDGTRTKKRRKDVKEAHGGVCKGTDKEKESCKDKECPVDCTWAQWGDWSDCSKTCGVGTRTKTRRKDVKEAHGGVCKGTDHDKESCKDKECPVDCTWAQWGDWSDCSKTCGDGTRT